MTAIAGVTVRVDKAEAACALMRAFGGEQEAAHVVGGVKWWQVRPGDQGYVPSS